MSAPKILGIPFWTVPIFAGFTWLGKKAYADSHHDRNADAKAVTLLSLITSWILKGSAHYPEMWPMQHLPYISNIGASEWGHPLFIIGAAITAASFSVTFVSERWLRHKGHLIHSNSIWGTFFWAVAALFTAVGTCAQVLLTVFCVRRHAYTHYSMVAVFA